MKIFKKILIITILVMFFYMGDVWATTGKVNVDATRIREENNTSSNIITNIYEGDEVEILEDNGDWYKIKYGSKTGYVKKEFITTKVSQTNTNSQNSSKKEDEPNKNEELKNEGENANKQEEKKDSNQQNANVDNSESDTNNSNYSKVTIQLATNLRLVPSFMSKSVMQIEQGKELKKLAELNNWIQVTDGSLVGWIPKNKINNNNTSTVQNSNFENKINANTNTQVSNTINETNTNNNTVKNEVSEPNKISSVNKKGTVKVETARVREKASSDSEIINTLDYGDEVTITSEEGEWYNITSGNVKGYVSKKLIVIGEVNSNITSRSLTQARENDIDNTTIDQEQNSNINEALTNEISNSTNGQAVVDYAKQYLGFPYVVGGKNPETGFDCSGFTRYVFMNFGKSLGSTAASQNSAGIEISRENIQLGDLILFYNDEKTKIGHTGIYIGNGDFIHAANPKRGVVIDNINTSTYYNERYIVAKRIVE